MAKRKKKKAAKKKAPAKAKGTNGKSPGNGRGNGHPGGPFRKGNDVGKDHRFQPGHPGGPGRPKGPDLLGIIADLMEREVEVTVKGKKLKKKYAEVLEEKALQHAMRGNAAYYKELHNRILGRTLERVETTLSGHLAITDEALSKLSTDELVILRNLLKKASGG